MGEDKDALRRTALAARRGLSPTERAEADAAICARLLTLPELTGASRVLAYAALPSEADPGAAVLALRARGAHTLFPRVRGSALDLVDVADDQALRPGYRGVREPVGRVVGADAVEVALVPGTAFDPRGGRLGGGGGHYDRLLARLPASAPVIGVAFACQMVPRVPREPHDRPVDLVVTEHRVYRPGAP